MHHLGSQRIRSPSTHTRTTSVALYMTRSQTVPRLARPCESLMKAELPFEVDSKFASDFKPFHLLLLSTLATSALFFLNTSCANLASSASATLNSTVSTSSAYGKFRHLLCHWRSTIGSAMLISENKLGTGTLLAPSPFSFMDNSVLFFPQSTSVSPSENLLPDLLFLHFFLRCITIVIQPTTLCN